MADDEIDDPVDDLEGGQSDEVSEPNPNEDPQPKGLSLDQVQESEFYKEAQRKISSQGNELSDYKSRFARFGGADQLLATALALETNDRFLAFVDAEKKRNLGEPEEMSEQEKEAMAIVDKRIDSKLNQRLSADIMPDINTMRTTRLDTLSSQMDKKYPGWRDLTVEMTDAMKGLPKATVNNPNFGDIEGLYLRTLAKNGKLDAFVTNRAAALAKKAKAAGTERNSSTKGRSDVKIKTIFDAAKVAEMEQ